MASLKVWLLRRPRWLRLLFAFCVLHAGAAQSAEGIDLSLTARAEAGLDPATRDFINHLPGAWRPQLEGIVNDTMNRVDKSVKTYLGEIDKLISDKMVETQCHVVAAGGEIVDDIVKRFPWTKQAGAMENLRNNIVADNARRHSDSSPTFIKDLYDDTMKETTLISCRFGGINAGLADTNKIMDDYAGRWLVWNRVESLACKGALECVAIYKGEVDRIVVKSDKRDREQSKANEMLAAYKVPDNPKWWNAFWSRPVDFDQIETALTQLYQIENSIGAAQALRESAAIAVLTTETKTIDNTKQEITAAFNEAAKETQFIMRMVVPGDRCKVLFHAAEEKLKQSAGQLTEAQKALDAAVEKSNIIQEKVAAQNAIVVAQLKRTTAEDFCKG
jgi:hypothetical protein